MQDSRIKILRDRPPFRIAPTESAFLQPSPPDRPSERGRFRIGDSDTEAGELAQSFAQIYEKNQAFFKILYRLFFKRDRRPKLQSAKTPCGALGGQSVFTVGERSGRDVRNRSEREAEAVPRRSGVPRKPTGAGAFREYPPPVSYAKRFRQAEHESRIRPDYAETRKRPSQTDVIRHPSRTRRVRRPTSAGRPPCRRVPWRSWRCRRDSSRSAAPDSPVRHPTRSSRRSRTGR